MIVVDASIAVAWFLPEAHEAFADDLATAGLELVAPDLVAVEVASALLKALRRGRADATTAEASVRRMLAGTVRLEPTAPLLVAALQLAARYGGSLYDATYIELARRTGAVIVTADTRLAEVARTLAVRAHMPADGGLPV